MADAINDKPTPAQRAAVYQRFKAALSSGELVRATACAWCHSDQGTMHGHHPDYNRPLMVVWICGGCHRKHHAAYRDERRLFREA